jgi:hypothetical protein
VVLVAGAFDEDSEALLGSWRYSSSGEPFLVLDVLDPAVGGGWVCTGVRGGQFTDYLEWRFPKVLLNGLELCLSGDRLRVYLACIQGESSRIVCGSVVAKAGGLSVVCLEGYCHKRQPTMIDFYLFADGVERDGEVAKVPSSLITEWERMCWKPVARVVEEVGGLLICRQLDSGPSMLPVEVDWAAHVLGVATGSGKFEMYYAPSATASALREEFLRAVSRFVLLDNRYPLRVTFVAGAHEQRWQEVDLGDRQFQGMLAGKLSLLVLEHGVPGQSIGIEFAQ